jgi:hypothetical protein
MGKENLRPMDFVDNSGGLELQFKQLLFPSFNLTLTPTVWRALLTSSWTFWRERPNILSERGDCISDSLRVSLTEDLSRISLLLGRVKLVQELVKPLKLY